MTTNLEPVLLMTDVKRGAMTTKGSLQTAMPPWIYGMHDPGEWRTLFARANKTGWVMFSQVLDPQTVERGNPEFLSWAREGYGVLARLVNGPLDPAGKGKGSIPEPEEYDRFAERCAAFVRASPGCGIWFIGNEMNIEWHWPNDFPTVPAAYVSCFARVYRAIKAVHPDALVIPSGLNPLQRTEAMHQDALQWFQDALEQIADLDGFDIHTYFPLAADRRTDAEGSREGTGGPSRSALFQILALDLDEDELRALCDRLGENYYGLSAEGQAGKAKELIFYQARRGGLPDLVRAGQALRPDIPWEHVDDADASPDWFADRYSYDHFMQLIPYKWRDLPVFLTEAKPPVPWPADSDRWMAYAHAEVDRWNQDPGHQVIHALLPYRWQGVDPDGLPDAWNLADKPSYRADLSEALAHDYTWQVTRAESPPDYAAPAEISLLSALPGEVWPGERLTVRVEIRNLGGETLEAHGDDAVSLRCNIARLGSTFSSSISLPEDIPPGESRRMDGTIQTDLDAGSYGILWLLQRRDRSYVKGRARATLRILDLATVGMDRLLGPTTGMAAAGRRRALTEIERRLRSQDPEAVDVAQGADRIADKLLVDLSDPDEDVRTAALSALYYLCERVPHRDELEGRVREAFADGRVRPDWVAGLAEADALEGPVRQWLEGRLSSQAPAAGAETAIQDLEIEGETEPIVAAVQRSASVSDSAGGGAKQQGPTPDILLPREVFDRAADEGGLSAPWDLLDEEPAAQAAQRSTGPSAEDPAPATERPPPERQFWFVTANPDRYDWDDAFAAGSVAWTGARGNEAQRNIQRTQPGDVVLAYRSTPDQYITGWGHVVGEPYKHQDRYAVRIEMNRKFDAGVPLDELKEAVPDLQHVQRRRPISYSPVTPEQWNAIRERILGRNPSLEEEDLPLRAATPERRAEVTPLSPLPRSLLPRQAWPIRLEVRNAGTVPWPAEGEGALRGGDRLVRLEPKPEVLHGGAQVLRGPVPPGNTVTVEIALTAPAAAGAYRIEWSLLEGEDSAWLTDPGREALWSATLEVMDPSVYLAELSSAPPDQLVGRIAHVAQVAQGDVSPGLRSTLVQDGLVPYLFDDDLAVRRAALYALYDLRKVYEGVEDLLREVFVARRPELVFVRELTFPRRARAPIRRWLQPLLPAEERGGAPALKEEPYVEKDTPASTVQVRELVRRQVLREVERVQDVVTTRTLDIHLTPRISRREDELEGKTDAPQEAQYPYQVLLTWLERTDGGHQRRYFEGPLQLDVGNEPLGRRYGAALHAALFHDQAPANRDRLLRGDPGQQTLLTGYRSALARRAQGNDELRLQLRIDNAATELHDYVWEYLWDPQGTGGGPLACWGSTPFARVLHVSNDADVHLPHVSSQSPLHVLVAVASPGEIESANPREELLGLDPIDLAQVEVLKTGLVRVGDRIAPLRDENVLLHATLDAICDRLRAAESARKPFHVLHLLCHGLAQAGKDGSCLVLETEDSVRADLVLADRLARRMREFVPGLQLVVLASCSLARPAHRGPLQGVARQLVAEAQVPAVVAMQDRLDFVAAQHFSQRLYRELVRDGEIDRAVNAARHELYVRGLERQVPRDQRPGPKQWGVPVLFMRQPDGRLFEIDGAEGEAPDEGEFQTEAVPYEQAPGSDPRRLATGALRAVAGQIGTSLSVDALALTQQLERAYEAARRPAAAPAPELHRRVLNEPGQEQRRALLSRAAREYRHHAARRTVLFVRSLIRADIARALRRDRLEKLEPGAIADLLKGWSEGAVVRLGAHEVTQILEGGLPRELDSQHPLRLIRPAVWRTAHRTFEAHDGADAAYDLRYKVNLVWSDEDGGLPDGDLVLLAEGLRDLLYGEREPFAGFEALTRHENAESARRLQRAASLLLHAVYPDRYVPYDVPLATKALGALSLQGRERYSISYRGYCALAEDLLADDDLGFEDMADVGCFLQGLEPEQVQPREEGRHALDLARLQTVNLAHDDVDTGLVLRRGVLEQATAALNAGQHVILIGPPGTGKTTLAEDLCRHAHDMDCNRGHVLVTATADWTTFDTIGGYMPEAGDRLVYRPGVFTEAIAARKWLVIDEINRADIDKAFGELFTVLSGQVVTLPYKMDDGRPVRILPPGYAASGETHDYAIHPSWRIIGTMNVYDKASLFAMSHAFMRRFAFVDVAVPAAAPYRRLLEHFMRAHDLPSREHVVVDDLHALFNRDDPANHLMRWRAPGPAIALDVVRYLHHRTAGDRDALHLGHLAEAIALYVAPQFEGLEQDAILDIYHQLARAFQVHVLREDRAELLGERQEYQERGEEWDKGRQALLIRIETLLGCVEGLLERVRELFPFVPEAEWTRTGAER